MACHRAGGGGGCAVSHVLVLEAAADDLSEGDLSEAIESVSAYDCVAYSNVSEIKSWVDWGS